MVHQQQRKKSKALWLTATIAIIGISYSIYSYYKSPSTQGTDNLSATTKLKSKRYTKKSIVIVLSNSIIAANLPLNEILTESENIIFVLSPKIEKEDLQDTYVEELLDNYKFLNCDNIDGLWSILKHLMPEFVFLCLDDLGIDFVPQELDRYVGDIIELDQNSDSIFEETLPYFIH